MIEDAEVRLAEDVRVLPAEGTWTHFIVDTHAHLDHEDFDPDREAVIERARQNGVRIILAVGYDIQSSERAVEFAGRYEGVYAVIGIHPHDAKDAPDDAIDRIRTLASHQKVVAVGEIGLDYHYDLSPRDVQRSVFISQLRLARELGLPVVIHDREAHGDVMEILKGEGVPGGGLSGRYGVLHCFSGSLEMARECIKMGFYISFGGPVTFKNARRPKEVAAAVPQDRLLVETDCPYLAPTPHRGERNEPAFVRYVVEELAHLRGTSFEDIASVTTQNAIRVFGIPFSP
ncbi:MAG TPA: TatD family hydrolase [Firmicutes bacterium]|nr:TatD family hydrolase [Bacillota bacterium]